MANQFKIAQKEFEKQLNDFCDLVKLVYGRTARPLNLIPNSERDHIPIQAVIAIPLFRSYEQVGCMQVPESLIDAFKNLKTVIN